MAVVVLVERRYGIIAIQPRPSCMLCGSWESKYQDLGFMRVLKRNYHAPYREIYVLACIANWSSVPHYQAQPKTGCCSTNSWYKPGNVWT
jgi:hypothetical protein